MFIVAKSPKVAISPCRPQAKGRPLRNDTCAIKKQSVKNVGCEII